MSDREPIDSLQIEIESSSTDAGKSLDALVSSLKKLDRIGKSNSFLLVKKRLKGIAEVQFDTLDKQLRSITKNIKTLEVYKKAIKNLEIKTPKIDTTSVSDAVETVTRELESKAEPAINSGEIFGGGKPVKPDWLTDIQEECNEIVSSFEDSSIKVEQAKARLNAVLTAKQADFSGEKAFISGSNFADTLSDKISKLELQASILKDKMDSLANTDETQWKSLEKQLLSVRLQYQVLEQQINKNASAVEELGDKSKKTKGFIGKMFDKFKNVAFYRIVRTLLAQLTRGITAGLENIAKFNEDANNVMSAYKTEFTYIKNSLGAALLPILQSLLPTITRISDCFVDITNSIGKISAALNGQKSFLQAKKYAQSYADTLEDVKKSTVGFDELNILGNSNSQNDASQMFETVDINGWDVAGSIAKITALIASTTTLVMLIKGVKLGDVFTKMGKGIKTAWTYLKNASGWKKAGISIAALATEAAVCYTSFYDAAKGTQSWGNALLSVIPTMALVGTAMYAMLGPVGLVAAAFVGVTSAIAGTLKANAEMRKEVNNKKFFEGASDMAVSLDDLGNSFSNVWAKTESMASATQNANGIINECAKEIKASYDIVSNYLKKLDEMGSLSETEATEIMNNVTSMVDGLETQMNTRMDSIFTTFNNLAQLCKEDFVGELGEMKTEFLAFQKLLGNATDDYKGTIDDLLDKVVQGTITEEEKIELQNALDSLASLNISYSDEQYVFDSLLEQALAGGVDLSNADTVNSFLSDLGTATKGYIDSLKTNYQGTDKQILEYMAMNQALLDQKKITQEEFDSYNAYFEKARTELKSMYDKAVQGVYDDVSLIVDLIQSSIISNISGYADDLVEEWNDASWWDKNVNIFSKYFGENEASWVYKGLNDVYDDSVTRINTAINDFFATIGSDISASLKDYFYYIKENAFDYSMAFHKYEYDQDIDTLIAEILSKYQTPQTNNSGSGTVGSSGYKDPLLNQWGTGPHPDYPNPSQWMLDYGVQLTKNEATVLRRELARRNSNGQYDAKISDLVKYIDWMNAQGYATGGFPEDGLFFANHSEMVGKFSNGKNAVANNEQIVEGIKRGVSEAMSESGGNDGGTWVIQIVDTDGNVKGEKIVTAAERKNRRDGKTVISVGG